MSGDRDYEVGYGRPPKNRQFVPGQSGFKGRRKRKETTAEVVRRVRDELVTVNGKTMTKFELSVHSVINQTIKNGKPRDLKVLFELLDKHGAIPKAVEAEQARAEGEAVIQKIMDHLNRVDNIDPADVAALDALDAEESQLIMGCDHCGPELRKRWREPDYAALRGRYGATAVHRAHVDASEYGKKRRLED